MLLHRHIRHRFLMALRSRVFVGAAGRPRFLRRNRTPTKRQQYGREGEELFHKFLDKILQPKCKCSSAWHIMLPEEQKEGTLDSQGA